jgi:putative component of membrane protein insertase Oxa1/YidC/SpoIIIJ protein YidD
MIARAIRKEQFHTSLLFILLKFLKCQAQLPDHLFHALIMIHSRLISPTIGANEACKYAPNVPPTPHQEILS